MLKIFLDDIRQAPKDWILVRNVHELKQYFLNDEYKISEISLDHDLGDGELTGYNFLNWLEEKVYNGEIKQIPIIKLHTANPVGHKNMLLAIKNIEKYLS